MRRRTVRAYAPTAAHQPEAREFFEFLSEQLESVALRDTLVVLGDLNAVAEEVTAPLIRLATFVGCKQGSRTCAETLRHSGPSSATFWFATAIAAG